MRNRSFWSHLGAALVYVLKSSLRVIGYVLRNFIPLAILFGIANIFFKFVDIDQSLVGFAVITLFLVGAAVEGLRNPGITNPSYTQNRYDDF